MAIAVTNDWFSGFLRELLVAAAFAIFATVLLFLRRLPALIRSIRGAGWPTAHGRVESVKVQTLAEQSLAEVAYSYLVEGERYAGYYSRQFADEQDAWDFLRPLQGQFIFVRYKPGCPEVSAVRVVDQGPMFAATQSNFAGRLLNRSLRQTFDILDWWELGVFASGNWPLAKGKIEFGTVTAKHICYVIPIQVCEMGYSYSVGGEYYAGHFQRTFFRKSSANQFIEDQKSKEVMVRYKPDSPNICVLQRRNQQDADQRIRAGSEKLTYPRRL
jgi:hypothetical protein